MNASLYLKSAVQFRQNKTIPGFNIMGIKVTNHAVNKVLVPRVDKSR